MATAPNTKTGWVLTSPGHAMLKNGRCFVFAHATPLNAPRNAERSIDISLHDRTDQLRILHFDESVTDCILKWFSGSSWKGKAGKSSAPRSSIGGYVKEPTPAMRKFLEAHPSLFDGLSGLEGFHGTSIAISNANARAQEILGQTIAR